MNPSLNITICDDSPLAQRQLGLAINHWHANISFANNGEQAIDAINNAKADLLFLDLNMPVMDGYQVLQKIRDDDLQTMVIVVSGDIQARALQKVTELGAIGFITKPISNDKLQDIVERFGLASQVSLHPESTDIEQTSAAQDICPTQEERFQETANIAMGKAAERLGLLLDTFINLSIPKVNILNNAELFMILKGSNVKDFTSIISQGFVGGGISGESILIVEKTCLPHIAKILGFPSEIDDDIEKDIYVDLAGLLSSSFLKAFFQQLGVRHINQGIPSFLTYKGQLDHLNSESSEDKMLAIEVSYSIPYHDIHCDLLLLFTSDSIEPMNQRSEVFSWSL